jgi:hypothetical protein
MLTDKARQLGIELGVSTKPGLVFAIMAELRELAARATNDAVNDWATDEPLF